MGPVVGSQEAGDSVQVEVMDQSLGNLAVKTGVESALESLETYTWGLWTPERVKGDFEAFKAHVLAQEGYSGVSVKFESRWATRNHRARTVKKRREQGYSPYG